MVVGGARYRQGWVLGLVLLAVEAAAQPQPCGTGVQRGQLVINEILYHAGDPALEFVELYNTSNCNLRVDELTLSDERDVPVPLHGVPSIPPGAYRVLVSNREAFVGAYGDANDAYQVPRWPTLNNGSDAVKIADKGQTIDSVRYHASWGTPGRSIERRDPNIVVHVASNWAVSVDDEGATPGRVNSVYAPDREPPVLSYAELESPRLVYVRTSEALHPDLDLLDVFFVDGIAPVAVDQEGPDVLWLRFIGDVTAATIATSGLTDAAGNTSVPHAVPVVRPPAPTQLLINEVMFDPHTLSTSSGAAQPEYVELVNVTQTHVALRGVGLSDEEDGRAALLATDHRVAVPPAGLVVVYESGGIGAAGSSVPPEFSGFDTSQHVAVWLPVRSVSPRGLANAGQSLALVGPDGAVLDLIAFANDWHSLTLRELGETRGTSLERRSVDAPSDDPSNWGSSTAYGGGTPGTPNSVLQNRRHPPDETHTRLWASPSPFSPDDDGIDDATWISFRLRHDLAAIRIRIFDIDGRPVRTLRQPVLSGSEGSLIWDGRDDGGRPLSMGIYIVLLETLSAEAAASERLRALVAIAY